MVRAGSALPGGCLGLRVIPSSPALWRRGLPRRKDKPMDKVFLQGDQMGQIGGVLGVVPGTLLGNINLQMPVILGQFVLVIGAGVGSHHARNQLSPAIEERRGLVKKTLSACSSSTWAL